MTSHYGNKYGKYKTLYLSGKTLAAAAAAARRRSSISNISNISNIRSITSGNGLTGNDRKPISGGNSRTNCPISNRFHGPKKVTLSDHLTILEFEDQPKDFGPNGEPHFYRARKQRSIDTWDGQLELENIKEDIASNGAESERIRLRGPLLGEEEWPSSTLTYTYPYGICGKDACQDQEGNCWMLATEKSGPTLYKTDQITTPGPHNKDLRQFRGLRKSNKNI